MDAINQWAEVKVNALRTAANILLPPVEEYLYEHNDVLKTHIFDGELRFMPFGIEGLLAVNLHSPPGHSCILVRGQIGAHSEKIKLRQRVDIHCLEGSILYFVDQQEPILIESRAINATGIDRLTIEPGQLYSFVVTQTCLNYSIFTPEL
jgi:hypothetical protein